ncbi:hypothetical protein FB451DRAFT_1281342 [Mycena latifolia]|nr:hypothetical protein FB451DRAFT_1281342 [Mycena latifolia]
MEPACVIEITAPQARRIKDNHWDRILNRSPSLVELADNFPEYSWDTSGWAEDCEREAASLPARTEVASRASAPAAAAPSFPTDDFSAFNMETPRRDQVPFGAPFANTPEDFPSSPLEAFHVRTPHLVAANRRFDAANKHADRLLAGHQPLADRRAPLADAANMPHGPIPSLHVRARPSDDVRKLIGQSSAEGKPVATGGRKPRAKGAKPHEDKDPRTSIDGDDLLLIGRAVVQLQPFLAGHGDVTNAWKGVNTYLRAKGFQHDVSYNTIQNKAKALIAYKKDPGCQDARSVASHLVGEVRITIAAVLEQMEKQWDDAKGKSDDAKAKIKKKNEDDRAAGEEIRAAAMRGRGRKRAATRSPSPTSDHESSPSKGVSTSSSLDFTDFEDNKKSKRRRKMDRRTGSSSSSAMSEITKILERDAAQREQHQKEVASTMKAFVDDAKESRAFMAGIFQNMLDKA